MLDLSAPIENFARVGPKFLMRLKKLGIKTARDLLWHFPARYEDYSNLLSIADIAGAGQMVSIAGQVTTINVARSWKRHMTIVNATVEDQTGIMRAVWFNQPYIADTLKEGTLVSLSGKISIDKNGLYLSSPSYEKVSSLAVDNLSELNSDRLSTDDHKQSAAGLVHTGRLVPVYPETEGLTSKYLRFLLKPLLAQISTSGSLPDCLPQDLLDKYNFPKLVPALQAMHFPENLEQAKHAKQRFTFEELLLFQLRALRDHRHLQTLRAPHIAFDKELIAGFVKTLPFELTNDQRVAAYEILQDLERPFPMNRLLNGDVGSGKTVVALIAARQTVAAGYQAVFMAPTEILARQHFRTITKMLSGQSPIRVGLLTGSEARQWPIDETSEEKISKKLMSQKIAKGELDIIIGTHAVIQKAVRFAKLGLVIIDEQHRFGVSQRMKLLKNQSLVPHFLSMTATPIPRTLALTIYGDLDVSLIKEKPKGRQTIITKAVPHSKRETTHKFIDEQIRQGRQVFVICPRIDVASVNTNHPSTSTDHRSFTPKISQAQLAWAEVRAVTKEYEKLSKKIFPHRRVAMLHGKMSAKGALPTGRQGSARLAEATAKRASGGKPSKEQIMNDFRNGKYDILVSTSVVEVGVDIPNATIMMIESAERFGLAQLHQFRGRVGRDVHQSYCFLFTSSDDTLASRRLRALEKTNDGFELAEIDLKIRGPGEFTGNKQSGLPDIAMSSLTDLELIKKARLEARLLLKEDPALKNYPRLLERLLEMEKLVHFE